jgi:hypothetical protein
LNFEISLAGGALALCQKSKISSRQKSPLPNVKCFEQTKYFLMVTCELEITKLFPQGDSGGPLLASDNNGSSFIQMGVTGYNDCRSYRRRITICKNKLLI